MPEGNNAEIDQAQLRISEAEQRVLRQRRRVEGAIVRGDQAETGRAALEQMELALDLMRAHLKVLQEKAGAAPVEPTEDYDLRDLSRRMGVTPQALKEAISAAGPGLDDVTARLTRKAG